MITPRWEGDPRGTGIADGTPQIEAVQSLLAALTEPGGLPKTPTITSCRTCGGRATYRIPRGPWSEPHCAPTASTWSR